MGWALLSDVHQLACVPSSPGTPNMAPLSISKFYGHKGQHAQGSWTVLTIQVQVWVCMAVKCLPSRSPTWEKDNFSSCFSCVHFSSEDEVLPEMVAPTAVLGAALPSFHLWFLDHLSHVGPMTEIYQAPLGLEVTPENPASNSPPSTQPTHWPSAPYPTLFIFPKSHCLPG